MINNIKKVKDKVFSKLFDIFYAICVSLFFVFCFIGIILIITITSIIIFYLIYHLGNYTVNVLDYILGVK